MSVFARVSRSRRAKQGRRQERAAATRAIDEVLVRRSCVEAEANVPDTWLPAAASVATLRGPKVVARVSEPVEGGSGGRVSQPLEGYPGTFGVSGFLFVQPARLMEMV